MEKFITEKVLLALLGKGMTYEFEDMEMDYEMKVPLGVLGMSDESHDMDVNIKMKVGKLSFEIQKD